MPTRLVNITLLTMLILAGCSGGTKNAQSPPPLHAACDYLTLHDARALIGQDVSEEAPRPDICGYNASHDVAHRPPAGVTLVVRHGRLDVRFALHPYPTTPPSLVTPNYSVGQDLTPAQFVSGLGHEATWQGHPTFGLLQAQQDDVLVSVFVQSLPDPEGSARSATVLVLRRLRPH